MSWMAEEGGRRTEAVRSALALNDAPAGTRHLLLIIGKLSSPINAIWLFLTSGAGPSDTRPHRLGNGTAVATRPLEGTRVRALTKNVGWTGGAIITGCHESAMREGARLEFELRFSRPKLQPWAYKYPALWVVFSTEL